MKNASDRTRKKTRAVQAAAVAAVALAMSLGSAASASAADGWAPPECKDEVQTVIVPGITTTVWYPDGGWYSAGQGGLLFKYKAIFYIAGQASEELNGTTYCTF